MKNVYCVLFALLGVFKLSYSQENAFNMTKTNAFEYISEQGKSVFLDVKNETLILDFKDLGVKVITYLDLEAMEVEGMAVYNGKLEWKNKNCEIYVQFIDESECTVDSECEDFNFGICRDKNGSNVVIEKTNPFLIENKNEKKVEAKSNFGFYDSDEFIEFSLLSANQKKVFLTERNWQNLGANSYVENGKVFEIWNFYIEDKNVKFFLTLKFVVDDINRMDETILSISSEVLYNSWVKELKSLGYTFERVPNEGDVYASKDGETYVIYLEKRKVKDMTVYEISVVNMIY